MLDENGTTVMSFDDHMKLSQVIDWAQQVKSKFGDVAVDLMLPEDFLPGQKIVKISGYNVIRGEKFGVVIPVEVQ
jgi:hypothetical protein